MLGVPSQARLFSTSSPTHVRIRMGPSRKLLKDEARRLQKTFAKGEAFSKVEEKGLLQSNVKPLGQPRRHLRGSAELANGRLVSPELWQSLHRQVQSRAQRSRGAPGNTFDEDEKDERNGGISIEEALVRRMRREGEREVVADTDIEAAERESEVLDLILQNKALKTRTNEDKKAAALERIKSLMAKMQQSTDAELDEEELTEETQEVNIRKHAAMRMLNKQRAALLRGQTQLRLDLENQVTKTDIASTGGGKQSITEVQEPYVAINNAAMFDELPNDGLLHTTARREIHNEVDNAVEGSRQQLSDSIDIQPKETLTTKSSINSVDSKRHGRRTQGSASLQAASRGSSRQTARNTQQRAVHTSRKLASTNTSEEPGSGVEQNAVPGTGEAREHEETEDNKRKTTEHRSEPGPRLTHVNEAGAAHMVSISDKLSTSRVATAISRIDFSERNTHALVTSNALKKGDVLSVARIAGIMAAKETPRLIPLCHPISLSHVSVDFEVFGPTMDGQSQDQQSGVRRSREGGVKIEARCECSGQTGVEMEALTAATVAGLTVYDMCKAVDKGMSLGPAMVVQKSGGKSGDWQVPGWKSINDVRKPR